MLKNLKDPREIRETMLSLLPTAGTLAGIGIGLAGMIHAKPGGGASTIADEILLLSALGFLLVCYLIFFALRAADSAFGSRISQLIDVLFLASLTLVVFSGFVVAYEFI